MSEINEIIIKMEVDGKKETKKVEEIEKIVRDLLTELVEQLSITRTHIKIKEKKDLDELMEEALANAPSIEGYTIRPLSECMEIPCSTFGRWPLCYPCDRRRTIRF